MNTRTASICHISNVITETLPFVMECILLKCHRRKKSADAVNIIDVFFILAYAFTHIPAVISDYHCEMPSNTTCSTDTYVQH